MELFSRNNIFFTVIALALVINHQIQLAGAYIGTNLGLVADNLPAPHDIIAQYKNEGIMLLRLYEPNADILKAINAPIKVAMGVKNDDVAHIGMDVNIAMQWVSSNLIPFIKDVDIGWILVGNEMIPSHPNANIVSQAMNNLLSALNSAGLTTVKVSTAVNANALGISYPPSAGAFSAASGPVMQDIVNWLAATHNPLFINVYPYFAYVSNTQHISLDYALFNAKQPVVDGQYQYYSLFEAMVDAFYAALEKVGGSNVTVSVAETGWPSAGNDPYTSKQNAQSYNQNLINKMKAAGTPRKPTVLLDILIFSMYNEDKKAGGIEQN